MIDVKTINKISTRAVSKTINTCAKTSKGHLVYYPVAIFPFPLPQFIYEGVSVIDRSQTR